MDRLITIGLVAALLCLLTSASWGRDRTDELGSSCNIQSIVLRSFPQADVILVEAESPIDRWQEFTLEKPKRIVVDLYGCKYQGKLKPEIRTGQFIRSLRLGGDTDKVRIAANVMEDVDVQLNIAKTSHKIAIYISAPETSFVEDAGARKPSQLLRQATFLQIQEAPSTTPIASKVEEREATLPQEPEAGVTVAEDEESSELAVRAEKSGKTPQRETAEYAWVGLVLEKYPSWELHGKLWNKFSHDTEEENEFEDDQSNHAEVILELNYVFNRCFRGVLSAKADWFAYGNNGNWDYDDDIRLYDAYVALSGSHYNLKVGNQIVKWGKTDEVSPLDNINPQDFRDGFVRRREERKIPIPIVNIELYRGLYGLQGLFIPFYEKSEIDILGRDWAFFDHFEQEIGNFEVKEDDYSNTFRNSEAGVRLSGTTENLDYAFSYFYTRDDLPSLGSMIVPPGFPVPLTSATPKNLAEFARTTNQTVVLTYERQSVTGVELETTWGDFGLRADAAYIYRKSFFTNELQSIRKPVFEYALGADYSPNSFYFNLQFGQTIVLDYDNRILWSDEVTNTLYGEITKGILDDNVELGFRAYYSITGKDYYYSPNVLLKYWDNVNLELGAEIVDGPDDTTLGLFEDNDQVYGTLEVHF
jgi:hypothetical protein